MVFDNSKATFEFDPCKLSCDPQASLYRMWPGSNTKYWSLDPYQHDEIMKPFVSFQLIKFC